MPPQPPQPSLNLLPTVQQAITSLLMTYEPEFLRFGYRLFVAFAVIVLAWHGIKMMLDRDSLGEQMFDFAKLLLFVSFGYALIAFYESPLPGIGVSFSNLITDQTAYFQSVLEARAFNDIYQHFDDLSDHFLPPDAWSIFANLIYWTVLLLIAFAKAVSLAVIAFGLIASAVCALLGPIFVPFFIVPKLDWLFWGWFRSFVQYLFVPVVAIAFLMIFEQFIYRYVSTLPPVITQDTTNDQHVDHTQHRGDDRPADTPLLRLHHHRPGRPRCPVHDDTLRLDARGRVGLRRQHRSLDGP